MTPTINNGCWNCRDLFKVTELDERGYPLHVHYCNDCVKVCTKCGQLHLVVKFLPDRTSEGFKDWQRTATEKHGPLGILKGRENYIAECMNCRPYYEMPEPPPLAKEPVIEMRLALIESEEEEVIASEEDIFEEREDPFAALERLLRNA